MNEWSAIFDMDGVLVDSSEAHFQAWHRLGMEVGKPFTRELFQLTFGMHNQQIVPLWMEQEVEQSKLDRLADTKETAYRQLVTELIRPIPGVIDLVAALHAEGITMAVGSSGPLPNIQLVLQQLGISHFRWISLWVFHCCWATCGGGGSGALFARRLRMFRSDICNLTATGGMRAMVAGSRVTSAFMSLNSSSSCFRTLCRTPTG